jgi:hypothetical protein
MAFFHSLLFLVVPVLPFQISVQTHTHHPDLGRLLSITPSDIFTIFVRIILKKRRD